MQNAIFTAYQIVVAQLGWVEQVIGAAAVLIVTAVIVWHRRQRAANKAGMSSMPFIIGCCVIALIAVGAAGYGVGLRPIAGSAAAVAAPKEAAIQSVIPAVKSKVEFLKNIELAVEPNRPLVLTGTAAVTKNRLRVFVDYSFASGRSWQPRIRVPIGEINEPVKDQRVEKQLVYRVEREGIGNELWVGDVQLNYPIPRPFMPFTTGPVTLVRMRIAIIDSSGGEEEQHCYFELLRVWPEVQGKAISVMPAENWIASWEDPPQ
jgi:hypothetical protein